MAVVLTIVRVSRGLVKACRNCAFHGMKGALP